MLSRLTARPLHLRFLTLGFSSALRRLSSPPSATQPTPPPPRFPPPIPFPRSTFFSNRAFSSDQRGGGGGGGDDGGTWKLTTEADEGDSVFGEEEGSLSGITEGVDEPVGSEPSRSQVKAGHLWVQESAIDKKGDIFDDIDRDFQEKGERGGDDEWKTAEGYKPWTLGDDEGKGDVFGIGGGGEAVLEGIEGGGFDEMEKEKIEEQQQLEKQEQELMTVLKGPNRAFGDLIAASGITEDMIDSLILLKDVRGIKGLPPLSEIEDKAITRMNETSSRAEIERKKQDEIAKARVRQVDEKGRAYGTGRRKCSVARVWIQPGDGKFIVNDKQFDAYFPILDHRADLLRPFSVTDTLGLWDVNCTVKGGGVSGQVGAIRLGISRALQNWEPGLRPYLKAAGYLTRDPRVVERKKPGKAKARKSFQWVKR